MSAYGFCVTRREMDPGISITICEAGGLPARMREGKSGRQTRRFSFMWGQGFRRQAQTKATFNSTHAAGRPHRRSAPVLSSSRALRPRSRSWMSSVESARSRGLCSPPWQAKRTWKNRKTRPLITASIGKHCEPISGDQNLPPWPQWLTGADARNSGPKISG